MTTEPEDTLTLDEWTSGDEKFALRVHGDAMIGEHIQDGDYVVIKAQSTAKDRQIVAIRDDDGEVTLRYFRQGQGHVWLEAANDKIKPVKRTSVEILGVLVGVVRKY